MEMVRDVAQGVAEEGVDEAMGTVEAMGSRMEAAQGITTMTTITVTPGTVFI